MTVKPKLVLNCILPATRIICIPFESEYGVVLFKPFRLNILLLFEYFNNLNEFPNTFISTYLINDILSAFGTPGLYSCFCLISNEIKLLGFKLVFKSII